jgi:DNA polymerase III alpha subunit
LVVAEKLVLTKDDQPMQFVTLEDETDLVEAVVFPDSFRRRGHGFTVGEVVPVRGIADLQDGVVILRWL